MMKSWRPFVLQRKSIMNFVRRKIKKILNGAHHLIKQEQEHPKINANVKPSLLHLMMKSRRDFVLESNEVINFGRLKGKNLTRQEEKHWKINGKYI